MRRTFALLLAAVMAAGTLTGPAMAAESQQEGTADSASQEVQEETKLPPDPEGTVTWANLDSRIRSGSLSARVLSENISGIEGIDYDLMYEDLRRQLNDIANAQWYITVMGGDDSALANAYDSLRDTFDDLKEGEVQADNADVVWQLNSTVDQMVAAGQTLYITLVGLEQQAADGQRSLAALDRSLEELRLRQQLGQVSRQNVDEVEAQRTQVVSQLNTLDTTITTYKSQLQTLIGAEPTGEISLGALPVQGEDGWTAPDYEADLAAAKAASWTLRNAEQKLDTIAALITHGEYERAIAFCNTKNMTDRLAGLLKMRGISCEAIHGDIQQRIREKTLEKFKRGEIKVLVATDVAARGLDIDDVDAVFNYDVPDELENYTHRIGRTGRAKRHGVAYTFIATITEGIRMDDIVRNTKAEVQRLRYDADGCLMLVEDGK